MNPSICIRFHSPLTKYCVIILKNRNSRKSSNSRKREVPVTKICANLDYCMLCYSKSEILRFRATFLTEYFNSNRWSIFQASHLNDWSPLFRNHPIDMALRDREIRYRKPGKLFCVNFFDFITLRIVYYGNRSYRVFFLLHTFQ